MTKLFEIVDAMVASGASLPELQDRVTAEGVLPLGAEQLPAVSIYPRRVQPGALAGTVYAREGTVLVVIRTIGPRCGRDAHELLGKFNQAVTTDVDLNDGEVQLDLSTETFRYVDSEQTICDLQAEYEVTFEVDRESLL